MDDIFVCLLLLAIAVCIVSVIGFIVKWVMKKPKKKWGIVAVIAFVSFWAIGFFWGAISCNHEWIEESRTAPTYESPGLISYKCSLCAETKTEEIDKLAPEQTEETNTNSTPAPSQEPETTDPTHENSADKDSETVTTDSSEKVDSSVTFAEIYREFKRNELNAKDLYNGNRYTITAKVNGMATGGLFNLTGGATLTMECKVDNTIVFFTAEFEKEQETNLKQISVGDTITFVGTCFGGHFKDCELQ